MAPEMSLLIKFITILVKLRARKPFEAHGYPFYNVEFNVTEDEYSKLHKDILPIATRVRLDVAHGCPFSDVEFNVLRDEYSKLLKGIPMLFLLRLRTVLVKLIARAPFRAHGYPFSVVRFNVTEDKYSKLPEDILAIATRVPSTELAKHNVTEEYSELLKDILKVLSTNQSELDEHKVLPWQTHPENEPPGWILIDLAVWDNVTTTIALRIDNLYLIGFTNRTGKWHTFDDHHMLIPGSTKIGFGGSYPALGYVRHKDPAFPRRGLRARGSYPGLRELPLNGTLVAVAVQKLLDYDPLLAVKEELQKALATLVLVICEAARFTEISETVRNGWNSVSYTYISRTNILTVWSRLSTQLLRGWNNSTEVVQNLENMLGIEGKEAAYLLLNVLILPTVKERRKKKEDPSKKKEDPRKKQEGGVSG